MIPDSDDFHDAANDPSEPEMQFGGRSSWNWLQVLGLSILMLVALVGLIIASEGYLALLLPVGFAVSVGTVLKTEKDAVFARNLAKAFLLASLAIMGFIGFVLATCGNSSHL